MCCRFQKLIVEDLKLDVTTIAKKLNYKNRSTIYHAFNQEAFPDITRLALLAKIQTKEGLRPNIHWLVTGEGDSLIANSETDDEIITMTNKIKRLTKKKRDALEYLITK